MKLTPEQKVDYLIATNRALNYLAKQNRGHLAKANSVALAIWPGHQMTSQGAGAAASRILSRLGKSGLTRWTSSYHNWGYVITTEGREYLRKAPR